MTTLSERLPQAGLKTKKQKKSKQYKIYFYYIRFLYMNTVTFEHFRTISGINLVCIEKNRERINKRLQILKKLLIYCYAFLQI